MGYISRAIEQRYGLMDAEKKFEEMLFGRTSATGVKVSANTAMNCVPYFAGVRIIAETVGQLPLIEYRRIEPRGKSRATNRRLYRLLHDEPNPEMGAATFKESLQGQAVTWGNAFAEIEWDMREGMPVALWPLRSDRMKVGRDETTRQIVYIYQLPDGGQAKLPAYRVWHMPGFGFDGLIGYDTIYLAREAIGMALAMEEYGARFFGNGAAPGGVLEHPNKLSTTALEKLRTTWNEMHQGLSNQHRIAVLEEGMKYHQIGIPPDNAQFLESRKFQLNEIARLLHIPPHMLADLDRATFSNIEHQGIEFVVYTMAPWFKRWEETCNRKLLLENEKPFFFFEYLVDALLRGDSEARAKFYKELYYMSVLSPNDIREKENMNPINDPNGDKYFVQQNMVPLDMISNIAAANQKKPLQDALKRVAEREKQNILRAAGRYDHESFNKWLADFYRDFPEFIERQVEPFVEDAKDFTTLYVGQSLKALKEITPEKAEEMLTGWEQKRVLE